MIHIDSTVRSGDRGWQNGQMHTCGLFDPSLWPLTCVGLPWFQPFPTLVEGLTSNATNTSDDNNGALRIALSCVELSMSHKSPIAQEQDWGVGGRVGFIFKLRKW